MNSEQITNIAIKVGEVGEKANIAFWIAIISAIAAIGAAIIAGYFKLKLNKAEKQHEKQWAYIAKRSQLIDHAIEVFSRMMFNKLLIAHNVDTVQAANNLFLLQKDALVIESQLVVYASHELADACYEFKNLIINTPNNEFIGPWGEIYKKGSEYLSLCRKQLGGNINEKFDQFAQKLIQKPPIEQAESIKVSENTMGGINLGDERYKQE